MQCVSSSYILSRTSSNRFGLCSSTTLLAVSCRNTSQSGVIISWFGLNGYLEEIQSCGELYTQEEISKEVCNDKESGWEERLRDIESGWMKD